jgi:two-component system OmpR family sensor kinase
VKIRPIGIRARLTLSYVLIFAVLLTSFGMVAYGVLKSRLDRALSEELAERAAALRGYVRFENGTAVLTYDSNDPEEALFIRVSTRYYQVYEGSTGRLLAQSPELEFLGLELSPDEVRTFLAGPLIYDVKTDQGPLRFWNDVVAPSPGEKYLVQVGVSRRDMDNALQHFFDLLLWLLPTGIAAAAAVGWWVAARALRPIITLAAASREIGVSDLNRRLPVRGSGDELDHLANAFNETFARLERAVDEMKQFTASISHELRTPLSILRGEAELALMQAKSEEDYRRVLTSELEEFDKLSRMINQLLTLARAEAGDITLERKPVDLGELVKSMGEQMRPVAESGGVTLTAGAEQEFIVVMGDVNWLERVILNLIDNAIKFTPSGGRVEVITRSADDNAIIEVTDTGSGIPAAALPHIFERFYQADPARSEQAGAGLGLSLAKWVVDQHEGKIEVSTSAGHGSSFRVVLPKN